MQAQKHLEQAGLTFALVPRWQRRPVSHGGGGEVGGGAVHLVGEGAVGQTLLFVPLANEARQGELVVRGEAGGVAEALRPRGAVLLDGTGLESDTRQLRQSRHQSRNKSLLSDYAELASDLTCRCFKGIVQHQYYSHRVCWFLYILNKIIKIVLEVLIHKFCYLVGLAVSALFSYLC